ncbi:MAG: hypothetical protein ACUVTX_00080 [Bacteroidales bacterium]
MKARILNMLIISVLMLGFSFPQVAGQEKTQEQKEKETRLQQAIEEQKKTITEQTKALKQQYDELARIFVQEAERQTGSRSEQGDPSRRDRTIGVVTGRDGFEQFYLPSGSSRYDFLPFAGDNQRTSLEFSKNAKESTFSKQFSFDVEKSARNVMMNVMGDCKTGEIKIKIIMPGGKTYSEVVIDESGNLNWRKSFVITEEENKDKIGEWIFKIDAAKATGSFRISIQTY